MSPPHERAVEAVRRQAWLARTQAIDRWERAVGSAPGLDAARAFNTAGRITLNFHPDRIAASGQTVAEALAVSGQYRSQWVTGISNGGRSAFPGGDRHRWEAALFAGAYDAADSTAVDFPVYGAYDLLLDPHGGSPRFGSSFLVLADHVRARTTFTVGDSLAGPNDIGTADEPWSVVAGIAEQAAAGCLLDRDLGVDDLLAALGRDRSEGSAARCLDGYVEAQVHGGVELATDVDALVVDPSLRTTEVEGHLVAVGERFDVEVRWHRGSELSVDLVPADFRGPTMPALARRVAGRGGVLDAHTIGDAARSIAPSEMQPGGDPPDSDLQQLKFLWHTLLAHGHDVG